MKIYAPDYYKKFSCIADKCKHSCCIGWDIEVDDFTYELYKDMGGEFAEIAYKYIVTDKHNAHSFKMKEDGRCPLLDENGLCKVILNWGDDIICKICKEHPRFRNYFSDREEIGLGLCCEAVAELIVSKEEKTEIIRLPDDCFEEEELKKYEKMLLDIREKAIRMIQDRSKTYRERTKGFHRICKTEAREYKNKEIYDIIYPLERLDKSWDDVLSSLLKAEDVQTEGYDTVCEQLAVYFIFRHINEECEAIRGTLSFALFSVQAIMKLSRAYYGDSPELAQIADIARMYSAEIEYSDCNINEIIEKILIADSH